VNRGWSCAATGGGGQIPVPVIQQIALPAAGSCNEAAPADLNWAGVPSGGWVTSWAQWPNDGRGGPVCTRTLQFSAQARGWTLGDT
jgi:hypothetical protein